MDPVRDIGSTTCSGSGYSTKKIQRISVVVPMFNEEQHVEHLVQDIAAQNFGGQVEVIVADGGSSDDSAFRLTRAAAECGLDLTVLENPQRFVSPGLNACIGRARGELIVRMDCHSRYPVDYLSCCVKAAEETGAWNVGGLTIPVGVTAVERAVACAQDSPFGGIGWTRIATDNERHETDTVVFGAFRRRTFEVAGLFDEALVRNQDDELNLRIRQRGGAIVLDPAIRAYYTPRGSLRNVFRQYFGYGKWKIPVMRKHRRIVTMRSLAPAGFVGSLIVLGVAGIVHPVPRLLLAAELTLYCGAALVAGIWTVRKRREPLGLVPLVVIVFPTFHLAYGLGMLRGLLTRPERTTRPAAVLPPDDGTPVCNS